MTRLHQAAAWAAIAGMGVSALAPWTKPGGGKPLAVLRSLVPWSALSALPVAVIAARRQRRALAVAATVVGGAGLAMAAPMVVPRRQPAADPGAAPLRVTHTNLLFVNRRVAAVAGVLAPLDADVLTFSELTPTHVRRLHASGLAAAYPHQIELPDQRASGAGLWSKWPLTAREHTSTKHHTIVADVHAPGGPVRVIVVHTVSPMHGHDLWAQDLDALATIPVDGPALMTGDFNASWWHPELRQLMTAGGWRDAHQIVGRGLSPSWPTDQWNPLFRIHPPFVRLDHALVNDGLRVLDAGSFDVPGSDHLGVVVTVQRARRAGP
jgi:endonuclease/exonuclease/phosphatase (EEP) superfamily protein YafD